MKEAKIEGFFTNHSLRRSGGTRLFNAGIDRKLVKEATGHKSDAVDQYQVTSDQQCEAMSRVIAGEEVVKVTKGPISTVSKPPEIALDSKNDNSIKMCTCQSNGHDVGQIIEKIVNVSKGKGKTTIKLEIEISNE